MGKRERLRQQILSGQSDANITFQGLRLYLKSLGFAERIKGDHHIFTHPQVEEIINLQPKGAKAKPYQVKQIRGILVKYRFGVSGHDSL